MSEYHEYFVKFHQDRLNSMNPEKPRKCKGCESQMMFLSKDNTLILSCGSKGEGKCGEQYRIHLPEYARYSRESQGMVNAINGSYYDDDPRDLLRYPLEAMSKITTPGAEETEALSEQRELIETAHKDLKDIKERYEKSNDIAGYAERVQELHGLRREVHRKRLRLMTQITNETDVAKRKELLQDYAKASLITSEIYPLIASLNEPWNDFVMMKEGTVKKIHNTYLDQEKPKNKPKNKPKKPVEDKGDDEVEISDCSKFKTNKGKRCPACCSGHPEKCQWVPKEGCKPK
jgi:hypothetical protein